MKLYLLESTFTSDPYEPSETLNWGVFDDKRKTEDAFSTLFSNIVNDIRQKHKEFNYKGWNYSTVFDFGAAITEFESAINNFILNNKSQDISKIWESFKEQFDYYLFNKYKEIFDKKPDWHSFCSWAHNIEIPRYDSFEIVEIELNKVLKHI